MKAISIRQPWAWAICHAGKDVENRTRVWNYQGPIAVHACGDYAPRDFAAAHEFMARLDIEPPITGLPTKCIVAMADLIGCLYPGNDTTSRWYTGQYGLVLRDVRVLATPVPCRGALGLWHVPADVAAEVERQVA